MLFDNLKKVFDNLILRVCLLFIINFSYSLTHYFFNFIEEIIFSFLLPIPFLKQDISNYYVTMLLPLWKIFGTLSFICHITQFAYQILHTNYTLLLAIIPLNQIHVWSKKLYLQVCNFLIEQILALLFIILLHKSSIKKVDSKNY